MLIYELSVINAHHLTPVELSEITRDKLRTAAEATGKLIDAGWSVTCQHNRLNFTHPQIVNMPETSSHLMGLGLASQPLMFIGDAIAADMDGDFEDDYDYDGDDDDEDDDDFDDEELDDDDDWDDDGDDELDGEEDEDFDDEDDYEDDEDDDYDDEDDDEEYEDDDDD